MNKDIQPKVYKDCVITCACGNSYTVVSTEQVIKVDICSACHPFYTGKQKFVDTEGRIEKFQKKMEASKTTQPSKKAKKAKKSEEKSGKKATLKDMLEEAQKTQA